MATKRQRSYGDPCGIARALDVVGERWALLVVRELLLGPKRFTDLRAGLPNVGPDVLAQRLRDLEAGGVIARRTLAPPAGSRVYELTDRGRALEPVVLETRAISGAAPLAVSAGPQRDRGRLHDPRPEDAVRSRVGRRPRGARRFAWADSASRSSTPVSPTARSTSRPGPLGVTGCGAGGHPLRPSRRSSGRGRSLTAARRSGEAQIEGDGRGARAFPAAVSRAGLADIPALV